jgi:hypothetical protein
VTASLICAWLSDGLLNGNRSIFIYTGAVGQIIFAAILRQRDIFGANITGTLVLYWFSTVSVSLSIYPDPGRLAIQSTHPANRAKPSFVSTLMHPTSFKALYCTQAQEPY